MASRLSQYRSCETQSSRHGEEYNELEAYYVRGLVLAYAPLSSKLISTVADVPSQVLEEYQGTKTKITSLEEPLREMQIHSSLSISDEAIAERERLQKEKESIKQCLAICAKASEHLRDKVAAQQERLQEKESTEQCLVICTKVLEHIGQLQSHLWEEFSRDIISIAPIALSY